MSQPARLLLCALVLSTPTARAEEPSPEVRARVVALTAELLDAIAPGKADVWDRILDEDAVVIDEFGRRQDKRAAVEAIRPLPPGLSGTIELREPRVHQHGDTVVLESVADEHETVFGQPLHTRYLFLGTFVHRAGDWKLVALEDVTLPADPPALAVSGLRLRDYAGTYELAPGHGFVVRSSAGGLVLSSLRGGPASPLRPVARDVFTDGGEEKNLLVFRRDGAGRVTELVERRKYDDLVLRRVAGKAPRGAPDHRR